MNSGECCARRWSDSQPVCLRWRDGRITELVAARGSATPEGWLAPPLVDLQVNGYGGIDFQQDQLTAAQLSQAMHALAAAGCGRCLVSLIARCLRPLGFPPGRLVLPRQVPEDLVPFFGRPRRLEFYDQFLAFSFIHGGAPVGVFLG